MFRTDFVHTYESLLEFSAKGVRVLGPGRHRRQRDCTYTLVDRRAFTIEIKPQEIPTAGGMAVRASAVVEARVMEPVAYITESVEPRNRVYAATQIALREAISSLTFEEVLERKVDLSEQLPAVLAAAAAVGLEVLDVSLKDVGAPYDLEQAHRATAIAELTAKADLERARSEAATLRIRANSVKLFEQHPLLARLQLLEAMPMGTKLVINGIDVEVDSDEG